MESIPPEAAAGAVWAKAEEMNTDELHNLDKDKRLRHPFNHAGANRPVAGNLAL
jgi:hypothetical protein